MCGSNKRNLCSIATSADCEGKCVDPNVLDDPDAPSPDPNLYYFCQTAETTDASSTYYGGECAGLGSEEPDANFISTVSAACDTGNNDPTSCPSDSYSVSDNGSNQVYCTTNSNVACGNPFGDACLGYDGDLTNSDTSITQTQDSATGDWTYTCILN